MSRGNLSWMLIVPALMLAGLIFSYSAPPPDEDYQLVRTVVDVLAEVDKNYYRNLSPEERKKLVEDMINGGLHTLDDHSQYFNEDALTRFEDSNSGEFGGVGIVMAVHAAGPYLTVGSPMPGTPAYDAGIAPGDVILKIDGKSTENLTHEQTRKLITGPPGTKVVLTMLRGERKEPEEIPLTRAKIEQHVVYGFERNPIDPAQWDFFPDKANKIAVIRLEMFNGKTMAELKPALEALLAQGARGLILDLRGNPGGLLSEAIEVSNLFLASGVIVVTKDRHGKGNSRSAEPQKCLCGSAKDLPMAVLIDRDSASASEIVAAALQDNERAILIGERSYGKGSVQKVFRLPPDDQRAVKLTSETWWTPKDRNIHRDSKLKVWDANDKDQWGVVPNPGYDVKLSNDDMRKMILLRKRIDVIPGKAGVAPPSAAVKPDPLPAGYQDPVIEKALEYLRTKLSGHAAAKVRALAA